MSVSARRRLAEDTTNWSRIVGHEISEQPGGRKKKKDGDLRNYSRNVAEMDSQTCAMCRR